MTQVSHALVIAFALAVAVAACSEDEPVANSDLQGDLQAKIEQLREQIEKAENAAEQHRGGLLGEIADTRREVLLLSAAMLENRLIAEQGGIPTEVVARTSTPDKARADLLLRHIAAAEEELERIEDAASEREGMAGSLSQAALATQELTIAQLRQAYFEAAYGLALPQPGGGENLTAAAEEPPLITSAPPAADEEPAAIPRAEEQPAETETAGGQAAVPQAAAVPPAKEPAEPRSYGSGDYAGIQRLLKQFGYDPGPVDGQWGPRTRQALIQFQRSAGLPPTGEPDPQSMDALGFD